MQIKANKKYRLTKEYFDFLTIKPQGEYIEIKMIYGNTVVFSDGISQFTDTTTNLIPNLLEPVVTFNANAFLRQEQKKENEPVIETPIEPEVPVDPIIPEQPTPVVEPTIPVEPTEPAYDPNNPYGEGYI